MTVAEAPRIGQEAELNLAEHVVGPCGHRVAWHLLSDVAVASHQRDLAAGQVAGADLEPHRRALQLPLEELGPGPDVLALVELDPHPGIAQLRGHRGSGLCHL